MNIRVGLVEQRPQIRVVLRGRFRDSDGRAVESGAYVFGDPQSLTPENPAECRFILPDVTIGIGFHWERQTEQTFEGNLIIVDDGVGLTLINEVPIESYVQSVIASEMSGDSPLEFLKAHAIISRSWVASQIRQSNGVDTVRRERRLAGGEVEITAWYGREAHSRFDVCADDHCQRYQGVKPSDSGGVSRAVAATAGEYLVFDGQVCDTRFSKCCGGVTDSFNIAWDDREVPYLRPVHDGEGAIPVVDSHWIRSAPPAWCNTSDPELLSTILPGFDQETKDFFRWQVRYTPGDLARIVAERTGVETGAITGIVPLARGRSGRIFRLRIEGRAGVVVIGKELEIRRVLSRSHLYSSAFVVDVSPREVVLHGAGWGHGVGLCQIGAAAQAWAGKYDDEILAHYYPGAETGPHPTHGPA